MPVQSLVERKRAAVRRELTGIALELFLRQGYAQTTVDAIGEAAGISRRTFFRYYSSKEEVVIGKWEAMGEDIIARFASRPSSEDSVTAIRASLDVVTEHYLDPDHLAASLAFDRIVAENPQLSAAFLYQVSLIELQLTAALVKRDPGTPRAYHRALIGAAGSCLLAAMDDVLPQRPEDLGATLDALFGRTIADDRR